MGSAMHGIFFPSRTASPRGFWPRELRRAALLLGASAALFWSSFAVGRWIVSMPDSGPIYVDLLLAWFAVLVHVGAWPALWTGLKNLRAQRPTEGNPVMAWRSFLLTLVLILVAAIVLPFQYHAIASREGWVLILYVTAFPYLGWMFVPILALHGILFSRVAEYLEPRSRYVAKAGAVALFTVAAATTAIILQNPGVTTFVRSWSVGRGLLPATALTGYLLIAVGVTARAASAIPRMRPWAPRRIPAQFSRWPARGPRSGLARLRFRWRSARGHP